MRNIGPSETSHESRPFLRSAHFSHLVVLIIGWGPDTSIVPSAVQCLELANREAISGVANFDGNALHLEQRKIEREGGREEKGRDRLGAKGRFRGISGGRCP